MSPADRKLMEEALGALALVDVKALPHAKIIRAKLTERLAQPELEKGSWQHAVDDAEAAALARREAK